MDLLLLIQLKRFATMIHRLKTRGGITRTEARVVPTGKSWSCGRNVTHSRDFFRQENGGSDIISVCQCFLTTECIWKLADIQFSSVQSLSRVRLYSISRIAACQASLSITNSQNLLKLMSIESVMPSYHLILCHPLLLLPSIFPSFSVFPNETVLCIRWSFSFSISPSNECSELVPFTIGGLISLQAKGLSRVFSNTTVQKHQFIGAQLSFSPTLTSMHDYWKNHSLD